LGRNEAAAREIEVDEGESVRKEKGKRKNLHKQARFFVVGGKRKRETISGVWGPHCHMSFFYVEVGGCLPHRDVYLSGLTKIKMKSVR
jgi:hypothetical protein